MALSEPQRILQRSHDVLRSRFVEDELARAAAAERIAALALTDPFNLSWAPLDFKRQTLLEGLAVAGFDSARPSYFSWLSVTYYLTRLAIDATLRVVAALPPPSAITLDFHLAKTSRDSTS